MILLGSLAKATEIQAILAMGLGRHLDKRPGRRRASETTGAPAKIFLDRKPPKPNPKPQTQVHTL